MLGSGVAGHQDQWEVVESGCRPKRLSESESVHFREIVLTKHQVGRLPANGGESVPSVWNGRDVEVRLGEVLLEDTAQVGIRLDDKDTVARHGRIVGLH